jgi:hypothetical protein
VIFICKSIRQTLSFTMRSAHSLASEAAIRSQGPLDDLLPDA